MVEKSKNADPCPHFKPNKMNTRYMLKTSSTQRREHSFEAAFDIGTRQREIEDSRNGGMSPPPACSPHPHPEPTHTPQAIHRTKGEVTKSCEKFTNFFNEEITKWRGKIAARKIPRRPLNKRIFFTIRSPFYSF